MELFHKPGVVLAFLPALVLAIVAEAIVYRQRHAGFPWLRIPTESSRPFRRKPAGDSDGNQPPIPRQSSHP